MGHFKQTLSSSSNSEGHLKTEVQNLTKTLNEERAKTEEFTTKLKEKDMNANRDLKTQAAMFEGDIAKLKGQIVDLNLDSDQLKSEVETLQSDILTKEIKIQNMATQREKQNKAMERWSHEHAYAEDMILQTVPKVVESLKGTKQARPNSQTWPNKETLNKLGYRDKLKVFQDVLLSTTTQLTKLGAEAVEYQDKEKDEKKEEMEKAFTDQRIASQQEKLKKKDQEYKELQERFEESEVSKSEIENKLRTESEKLA